MTQEGSNILCRPAPEAVLWIKTAFTPTQFPALAVFLKDAFVSFAETGDVSTCLQHLLLELKRTGAQSNYSSTLLSALAQSHLPLRQEELLDWMCRSLHLIDLKAVNVLCKELLADTIQSVKKKGGRRLLDTAVQHWQGKHRAEAVRFVRLIGMQNEFVAETCPLEVLVKTNEIPLAEELVSGDVVLVSSLVRLLRKGDQVKVAGRLIRQYKLNKSEFPDICRQIKMRAVHYFVNSEELALWRLAEIVEEDREMLGLLVDALLLSRKATLNQLALHLAQTTPSLLYSLRPKARNALKSIPPSSVPVTPIDDFVPENPQALRYPLSPTSIVFVASNEDLASADLEGSDVVGFDCEWLPPLISINDSPVALFQIATRNQVFLLDMLRLNENTLLDAKLTSLFANRGVVKVGMSFLGDLKKLGESCPGLNCFKGEVTNYADLHTIHHQAFKGNGGLKDITQQFLGKPLCKAEQRSGWTKRPLRKRQVHYAALDAYVEILLWDRMQEVKGEELRALVVDLRV